MKLTALILLFLPILVWGADTGDSLSRTDVEINKLKKEIEILRQNLDTSEAHLKEMGQMSFQRNDERMTGLIWTYGILGGLFLGILAFLSFIGPKNISNYADRKTTKIIQEKVTSESLKTQVQDQIREILTPGYLKEEIESKAETTIQESANQLTSRVKSELDQQVKELVKEFKGKFESQLEEIQKSHDKYTKLLNDPRIIERIKSTNTISKRSSEEKEALETVTKAIEVTKVEKNYSAEDWKLIGQKAIDDNALKDAQHAYEKARELDPEDDTVWFWLGWLYSRLSDLKRALKCYDTSIKLNPKGYNSFNNRGVVKHTLGFYDKAIEDYTREIKNNPRNNLPWSNRGEAKIELEQFSEAMKDLNHAIELNEEFGETYSFRAYASLMLENPQSVEEDIRKALELDPDDNDIYYYLGLIRHKQDRLQEACEAWTKAAELGYEDAKEKLAKFCNGS